MQRRLRPRRALALTLTMVAVIASGCVKPKDPSVNVTKVEANLVFGVKEPEPVVSPATAKVGPPAAQPDPGLGNRPFETKKFPDFAVPLESKNVASDCPAAPPSAAAKGVVDVNITGDPAPGIYKWKSGGFQKPSSAPAESPGTPITGFEKRLIQNFKRINPTTTTFQAVELPFGGGAAKGYFVSTFQVKTAAVNRDTTGSGVPVSGPRAGEPDRGVALVKLEQFDSKGSSISSFQPGTGLLYLPLPVSSGESYQSVGVDPKSGQTIVHDATVLGRERVDACGELVDGWAVEAHQVSSGGRGQGMDVKYKYLVAPQMGGMLIFEQSKFTLNNVVYDLKFNIGQLTPDPLPAPAP